jgi:hypothetical protein
LNTPRRFLSGFEATSAALAALPQEQKLDALVHVLTEALLRMPLATLRRKRARFLEHFSQCGCSFEVCCAVQDLVDLHLAQRSRRALVAPRGTRWTASAAAHVRRRPRR